MSAVSRDLPCIIEAYPGREGLAPNASRYVHRDSSFKARGTASAVGRQRGVRYKEEAIVVLYSDSLFIQ